MVGIEHKLMSEDVAEVVAGKVKIAVMREIEDGRFVGFGFIADFEFIIVCEGVNDCAVEISGIAFFAVLA